MNKLTNTALFLLMSVVLFAQRTREVTRPARGLSDDGNFPTTGVEPLDDGGQYTPVDQYVYFLIAIAVVMIAYIVYRRIQLSKTA